MKIEGDVMVVKLEVGEKEDAKKVCPPSSSSSPLFLVVGLGGRSWRTYQLTIGGGGDQETGD